MKKIVYFSFAAFIIASCGKNPTSDLIESETLEVEEKNMGVYAVRTATWCGPCGQSLNGTQEVFENVKDVAVAMSFKDAFGEANAPWGNHLFDLVPDVFGIATSVPTTFQNFNIESPASINEHIVEPVIVSGNYEMEFNGTDITIKTTTKFFDDFGGDVYLAPFIIVDSLVGAQNSHPDSPNTVHMKYVADVAYLANKDIDSKHEWGYLISSPVARKGEVINLEFKASKQTHWMNHNISVGMVYFKKVGDSYQFINAFTK